MCQANSVLEFGSRDSRLSDDRAKRAGTEFPVIRHGHRCCGVFRQTLHDDVTSATAHLAMPCRSRMAQTSRPDKVRSLPNGNLELRYENLATDAFLDFFGRSALEEELERFSQVFPSRLDRVALAGDIEFRAQRHVAVAFTLNNCCESLVHTVYTHTHTKPRSNPSRDYHTIVPPSDKPGDRDRGLRKSSCRFRVNSSRSRDHDRPEPKLGVSLPAGVEGPLVAMLRRPCVPNEHHRHRLGVSRVGRRLELSCPNPFQRSMLWWMPYVPRKVGHSTQKSGPVASP